MQSNITAVATVSALRGVVLLKLQDQGVNEANFQQYLKDLSKKMNNKPFFLYMDNLFVHKMNVV